MVLLNFDGASKGNPGKARFGGIFRNHKGNVLQTFMWSIGWDTNNSTKLEGMWQGLLLAQSNRFLPIIIEGDSQILINMINQILQGTPTHKVGSSWILAERLEWVEHWILIHREVTIRHICLNGNKVTDLLANIGIESGKTLHVGTLSTIANTRHL